MNERADSVRSGYLVIIDEFTLWRALRHAWAGRRVYHFRTDAILPVSGKVLGWLVARCKAWGWLREITDLAPDAEIMAHRARMFGSRGWYRHVEPVFFAETGLSAPGPDPFDIIFPLKKQTANYIADHFDALYFAQQLHESGAPVPVLLFGNPAAAGLVRAAVGESLFATETTGGGRWLNAVTGLLFLVASIAYIAARLRWRPAEKTYRYLGSDGTDPVSWSMQPISSVLGSASDSQVMIVFRNHQMFEQLAGAYAPLPAVRSTDGVFGPRAAWRAIVRSARQMLALRQWFHLYPGHFVKAAKIVYLRNVFDAFFNKYHFDVFWSFDEYNVEHILRTEAMRQRGIRSVAKINGVNVFKVDYAFRYIDYDSGYVISAPPMDEHNGETWRRRSSIKGFGSFGLSRADLRRVASPRPPDILCFAKPWFDGPALPRMMAELAAALPGRRITIAAKSSSKRFGGYEDYEAIVRDGPANLVLSEENSFQLILRHRYCLCSESSILAEAMELGCMTFFLDTHDERHVLLYRDYKEICVRSAADIASRVRAIEAGKWTYPRAQMGGLIKLSGETVHDLIRKDWGLPPYSEAADASSKVA